MRVWTFGRGLFRLWLVVSLGWVVTIASLYVLTAGAVAWPWQAPTTIHVTFSDSETLDYPAEWGIERIRAAIREKRAPEKVMWDSFYQEQVAALAPKQKAFCDNKPTNQVSLDCPENWQPIEHPGWEDQFYRLPQPAGPFVAKLAGVTLGPPALVFILALALLWVIRGFRRHA